jgi:hypothetical protein
MYSGPLSQRIAFGLPRHSIIRSSDLITRSDSSEKSTSIPKPSAIEIIDDVEQADAAPVGKLVMHEVHRSALVDRSRHSQWDRLLAYQAVARLDSQIQLELTVNPVNPFMVPFEVFDVAQVQKAQPKASVVLVVRQPYQPISDDAVFRVQLGLVPVAGLADAKRATRQVNRG